ncbi:peptidyl-prolyl cis-trans isomerase FKBP3 isoform X2 [Coturnix japonica]|uniref:peptidyl-prolyl cis-trans isomerase FKBP3 isoform X2 n=1 Tax=Coturnix japonica TaxID=93934 RepID=UPI00077700DC|nr:peptidyl-prolyl cis-trans isomerase FKBP3 isoform X2 [Coturnix japonica]
MAAGTAPAQRWSDEELRSETLPKKDIIKFLQEHAAQQQFKGTDGTERAEKEKPGKAEGEKGKEKEKEKAAKNEENAEEGPPKYTKSILKKGDKTNFPKKGDTVHCWYTGKLQDGTVFDTNVQTSSKKKKAAKPLSFKVGIGKVIRGWDEALLTMSKGEKAQLEIEPEWAYGKKGQPDAKIPPNAKLFFEVELVDIE